jgi:hypothetical protein
MDNVLHIKVKDVYGNRLVYPQCEKSIVFAHISGRKTLTDNVIASLKSIGYVFEVVGESL